MDLSSSVFGNECEDESLLTQIPIDDAPPLQVDPQNGLIGFHPLILHQIIAFLSLVDFIHHLLNVVIYSCSTMLISCFFFLA